MNTVIPPQTARQATSLKKHAEAALERFTLNIQMTLRMLAAVAKRRAEHQKITIQNVSKKTGE